MNSPRNRRTQQGYSLIEVLIAFLVLSIGLVGMALLQAQGTRFNTDAYARTQATMLAYDIIDRMRANPTAFGNGVYDVSSQSQAAVKKAAYNSCRSGGTCTCESSGCGPAALALYDLGFWYTAQNELLNAKFGSLATIQRVGQQVTVTMRWSEQEKSRTQSWVVEY
ncbi:MAG: type IV pilus modification protein PilV [Gammaproteobacteria bacterium]|nr:type IV pilus modification protein PilV [Gammaproteobacteria bacterium]